MSESNRFPKGWNEERVRRLLDHYEHQGEEEAVAEDEAAVDDDGRALIEVPKELVPEVRKLISRRRPD